MLNDVGAQSQPRREGTAVIQSVDRAARILHELGSGSPTLGVTELGARLDLAKPTVHGCCAPWSRAAW